LTDASCERDYQETKALKGISLTTSNVVTYRTNSGKTVEIEIDPLEGFAVAGADQTPGRIRTAIEPALEAAETVLERVKSMAPGKIEVKFGVKVTGTANWLVAKAATEGNFEITLTWQGGGKETTE
jgi:Trypsin-co-occurring domain 1